MMIIDCNDLLFGPPCTLIDKRIPRTSVTTTTQI